MTAPAGRAVYWLAELQGHGAEAELLPTGERRTLADWLELLDGEREPVILSRACLRSLDGLPLLRVIR